MKSFFVIIVLSIALFSETSAAGGHRGTFFQKKYDPITGRTTVVERFVGKPFKPSGQDAGGSIVAAGACLAIFAICGAARHIICRQN